MNALISGFSMNVLRSLIPVVMVIGLNRGADAQQDDPAPIKLVEQSVAACLEIPHAESTWRRIESSRLKSRLTAFPPLARLLQGGGLQKWISLEDHVQRVTGKSLSAQLLTGCSESLVIAIYAPENQPPEGVFLAQARDAAALSRTIAAWETLEPQQQSTPRKHLGQTYIRRMKSPGAGEELFYVVLGRTIALSDREHRIQQVIELASGQAPARDWAATPAYRASRATLPGSADAYFDLNPRAWESAVVSGLNSSPDATWLRLMYRQFSAVSVALRLDEELVLDVVLEARDSPLSAAWTPLVTAPRKDWAARVPGSAILALSSQWPAGSLIQTWVNYAPEARTSDFTRGRTLLRSILQGHDLFSEVLPAFLSDWTLAVIPGSTASIPLDAVGQFQIPTNLEGLSESLDHGTLFGMTAMAAGIAYERPSLAGVYVKSRDRGPLRIHEFQGLPTWNPAVAISADRLNVATSATALTDAGAGTAEPSPRLAANEQRYFPGTVQLIWLDCVRLHELLTRDGERLVQSVIPQNEEKRDRLRRQLQRVDEASQIADALFVAIGGDQNSLRLVIGASLDRPTR